VCRAWGARVPLGVARTWLGRGSKGLKGELRCPLGSSSGVARELPGNFFTSSFRPYFPKGAL
jgi:hypothetical protein